MKTAAAAALAFVFVSAAASAQEAPPPSAVEEREEALLEEEEDADEERARPRRHIQVLQHPYEIASFYRSAPPAGPFALGEEPPLPGEYAIAGFYRSGASARGGWSSFWTTGYGSGRAMGRSLVGARRVRPLGLNGDLVLFAPTFLAPVGPLTGVFLE